MATTCPDRAELSEFALGRLDEQRIDSVTDHLEQCDECQTTVGLIAAGDDTFVEAIREIAAADEIADEPQCQAALDQIEAIGHKATPDDEPRVVDSPGRLREYQLLAKLGEGGMGTVYKALHTRLRRVVALKVLASHRRHDPSVVERFAREIEAVGKLNHPNIVTAHDAGEEDGMHYLVMELVEGVDLHTLVGQHGPLPVADACEIIRQAALGLQHAHEHGLVHRDLKPSNLMLAKSGERRAESFEPEMESDGRTPIRLSALSSQPSALVKILDLGLARLQGEQQLECEEITATGQVMGTLDYMAPEQADDSHAVDIRADIYALGCTLHKLLTGHAPFSGKSYNTVAKKLRGHAEETPPAVCEARSEVPEPLAALMARMLAKSPEDRPATPGDLAAAVEPFCKGNDLPGLASQIDLAGQQEADAASEREIAFMLKNSRRKKRSVYRLAVRTVAAAAFLMLAGAVMAAVVITIRGKDGRETKMKVPDGSLVEIDPKGNVTVTLSDEPCPLELPEGVPIPASARTDQYGDPLPLGAVARIGTHRFRHGKDLGHLSFSADGRVLISSGWPTEGGRACFWDFQTGRLLGQLDAPAMFLADGTTLAIFDEHIRLWDTREGNPIGQFDRSKFTLLSPDGKKLAHRSRTEHWSVTVSCVATGEEQQLPDTVMAYLFSPDGRYLVTRGNKIDVDGHRPVCVWDLKANETIIQLPLKHGLPGLHGVRFSPDATKAAIIVGQEDDHRRRTIQVLDLASGAQTQAISREALIESLAFSPDGKTLAWCEWLYATNTVQVQTWDVARNKPLRSYKTRSSDYPYDSTGKYLVFSPDGKSLALGLWGMIHVWDVTSGLKRHEDQQYRKGIARVAITHDGGLLATASHRGMLRLWDAQTGVELQEVGRLGHHHMASVTFSRDGCRLAATTDLGIRLYEKNGGAFASRGTITTEDKQTPALAFADDGKRLLSLTADGATVWDVASRKPLIRHEQLSQGVQAATFSDDGALLATIAVGRGPETDDRPFSSAICCWDVETGTLLDSIPKRALPLRFTPDNSILVWADNTATYFRDVKQQRDLLKLDLTGPTYPVVSPDFRLVAQAHHGSKVGVWDLATGRKLLELAGHSGAVRTSAFSGDGRFLVSGSSDTTALVWDLELARAELRQHVSDVARHADGRKNDPMPSFWANPPGAGAQNADRAMWTLAAGGPSAIKLLAKKLETLGGADDQAGHLADPATSPGPADRAQQSPSPEDIVRAKRAIMALERIGSDEAQAVLESVASAPVAEIGTSAQRAIRRLAQRESPKTSRPDRPQTEPPSVEHRDRHGDALPPSAVARLGTSRFRQGTLIGNIVFLAEGKLLATTDGNTIRLWDRATGRQVRQLAGPTEHVGDLAVADGGKTLVSCNGNKVRYWDPQTGEQIAKIDVPAAREGQTFYEFDHSRTGDVAVIGFGSNSPGASVNPNKHTVVVIDRKAGGVLRTFDIDFQLSEEVLDTSWPVVLSPDGRRLAISRGVAGLDIWDVKTGERTDHYKLEQEQLQSVAYSPDGRWLAASDLGGRVRVWNARTGKPHQDPQGGRQLAFSEDGSLLATCWGSDSIRLYDVAGGKLLRSIPTKDGNSAVAWSPDGPVLAVGGYSRVALSDAKSGKPLTVSDAHEARILQVAFSPDDRTAVTRSANSLNLWEPETGTLRQRIEPPDPSLRMGRFAFTADGDLVICQDNQVGWYDANGKLQRILHELAEGETALALACLTDRNQLALAAGASGMNRDRRMVVLESKTGRLVRQFHLGVLHQFGGICLLPDGQSVMTAPYDLYDPSSPGHKVEPLRCRDLLSGRHVYSLKRLKRDAGAGAMTASADSRILAELTAAHGRNAQALRLWDLVSRQVIREIPMRGQTCLAISPRHRVVATGGDNSGVIKLWDISAGEEIAQLEGHRGRVLRLAFSSNGERLVSGGMDGTALIWDIKPIRQEVMRTTPVPDAAALRRSWYALSQQSPDMGVVLKPAARPTTGQQRTIDHLIGQLSDNDEDVWGDAAAQLEVWDYLAVDSLHKVEAESKSLEFAKRVKGVLQEMESPRYPSPERQIAIRAIRVLEYVRTEEARRTLRELAAGATHAPVTKEAKAALARLSELAGQETPSVPASIEKGMKADELEQRENNQSKR